MTWRPWLLALCALGVAPIVVNAVFDLTVNGSLGISGARRRQSRLSIDSRSAREGRLPKVESEPETCSTGAGFRRRHASGFTTAPASGNRSRCQSFEMGRNEQSPS